MKEKFLHGFVFGLGFTLAMALVMWLISMYQISTFTTTNVGERQKLGLSPQESNSWRDMVMSEKIPKLTGVVLLRFKEGDDKLMAAYVDSIYTKEKTVNMPLHVGDRVEKQDYYAKDGMRSNRDGILLLYVGDPPKKVESAYLYDSRLVAHGDMPLKLFLKKFKGLNDRNVN